MAYTNYKTPEALGMSSIQPARHNHSELGWVRVQPNITFSRQRRYIAHVICTGFDILCSAAAAIQGDAAEGGCKDI